jgi:hypothetical protein
MVHAFIHLLAIAISSLMQCLYRSLAQCLIKLLLSLQLIYKSFLIFAVTVSYFICLLQIFSHTLNVSFHSLGIVFHRAEKITFNKIQLINSFLQQLYIGLISQESSQNPRSSTCSLMLPSWNFSFVYYILFCFEFWVTFCYKLPTVLVRFPLHYDKYWRNIVK